MQRIFPASLLGLALIVSALVMRDAALTFKEYERTVKVKGLAEREVPADIAIWPIKFVTASNDLAALYGEVESKTAAVLAFLHEHTFGDADITIGAPAITDKLAQAYGNNGDAPLRYTASQVVTVYSDDVAHVRAANDDLIELVQQGVVVVGDDYQARTQYLFTGLNDIKPAMVEEATRKAREVAQKFADDSGSRLGRIRRARQGIFTISDRDSNTPYIKKVRIVSTLEYYLVD